MRGIILLVLLFQALTAAAQDWVLLNPAYRYNYSNDGTDTIRHQIRVMDVDTLGPDSFRYELNRVAVVCDTCPAIGNTCAGCFVRVNQPQFLGIECVKAGNDWRFFGADTFIIRGSAGPGATWSFDLSNGVTATVDAEWTEALFGVQDTLRSIVLSSQDTIILSRSFGIRRFCRGSNAVELIGVEGPGVGRVYPNPLAYFDYQPGDELTYWLLSIYHISYPGGLHYNTSLPSYWKVRITGRMDSSEGVFYTTSWAIDWPGGLGVTFPPISVPDWPVPYNGWSLVRDELLVKHPLLGAFPGEVIDTSICENAYYPGYDVRSIAQYSLAPSGKAEMRYQPIGPSVNSMLCGFNATGSPLQGMFPRHPEPVSAWYEEGVGLRTMWFRLSPGEGEHLVELVGAVIGGDTIVPPPVINWDVAIVERENNGGLVFPNPATDRIFMKQAPISAGLGIRDLEGRLVLTQHIASANETIDVQHLAPGIYFVSVDGVAPQRVVIAR
ncbi:MAG: T9SS type A sorting domain-containing protein [Flavobacteriales bacterium]|nr:MAG: T9SS type A sorting domain-containing protein [Flavobacteriales bacterium]